VAVSAAVLAAICFFWCISNLHSKVRQNPRVGRVTGPFQLAIGVYKTSVKVGDAPEVTFELRNVSASPQYIYTQGLCIKVCHENRKGLRERLSQWLSTAWRRYILREGSPDPFVTDWMWSALSASRDAQSPNGEFQRIAPGDSFSTTMDPPQAAAGRTIWRMQYSNDKTGEEQGLQVWTGSIEPLDSVDVRVSE